MLESWGTGRFDHTADVSIQVVPVVQRMQGRLALRETYTQEAWSYVGLLVPTTFAYGPEIYYELDLTGSYNSLLRMRIGIVNAETYVIKSYVADQWGYGKITLQFPAGLYLNNDPLELLYIEVYNYSDYEQDIRISGTGLKATYKVPYQYME